MKYPERQVAIKTIKLVNNEPDRDKVIREKKCMIRVKKNPNVVAFLNYSMIKLGPHRKYN